MIKNWEIDGAEVMVARMSLAYDRGDDSYWFVVLITDGGSNSKVLTHLHQFDTEAAANRLADRVRSFIGGPLDPGAPCGLKEDLWDVSPLPVGGVECLLEGYANAY